MNKLFKKSLGFTLIELLFVIAIIGVLASLGISMAQKKTEEFKVKKTALQMQQIMQAAMTYYVNKRAWPAHGNTYSCDPNSSDFCSYLPALDAMRENPWIDDKVGYFFSSSSPTDPQSPKFVVIAKVSSTQIAQRIATLLPNAYVPKDYPKVVHAEITVPGQAAEQEMQIKEIGKTEMSTKGSSKPEPSPTCGKVIKPAPFVCLKGRGEIFITFDEYNNYYKGALSNYMFAWIKYNNFVTPYTTVEPKPHDTDFPHCVLNKDDGKWHCDFQVCVARGTSSSGIYHPYTEVNAVYMTLCLVTEDSR